MPIKRSWGKKLTWPARSCLADNDPDVLRTFFHLQREVQACRHNQIGIGIPYGNLGVESSNIQLGGRECLLSRLHAPSEAGYLCFVQATEFRKTGENVNQVETRLRTYVN